MYNLLVSADPDAWKGGPWQIELSRSVREYTDEALTQRYGELDNQATAVLLSLPTIFAYETGVGLPPKLGMIREVTRRQGEVRVQYEVAVDPFLTHEQLLALSFELDLGKLELHRTHWAVKDVDLAKELKAKGIDLPSWVRTLPKSVNVTTHEFDVALSFPGEVRDLVREVAAHLERLIGPNAYFYDENFQGQLARPSLDLLLQDVYGKRSKLIVVFLGSKYEEKDWCGIEFRAIREIINDRKHERVMYVRTDDGEVQGVFKTDGYLSANKVSPSEIAHMIQERLQHL